jgi:hypothetical protein
MSAFVVVEHEVAVPLSDAFGHFVDFTRWAAWMPSTFSPHTGPGRPLQAGDKFKVRVGKLPIALHVLRLRPNAEVCWRGGSRLVMQGDHSFTFTELGGKTRIRSEETLSGLLTLGFMAARIERSAAAEARTLLQRFADYVTRQAPVAAHVRVAE